MCPAKSAKPIEMPFGQLTRVGPRNYLLDRGRDSLLERDDVGELSGSLKSTGNFCCGVHSERDHSILSDGMTAERLQPTAVLSTGRCHITLSP